MTDVLLSMVAALSLMALLFSGCRSSGLTPEDVEFFVKAHEEKSNA